MLVRYGQRPNELTVKKLAMLGCVALVLAHSVKDIREKLQNNAYAGDQSFDANPHQENSSITHMHTMYTGIGTGQVQKSSLVQTRCG